MRTNRRSTTRIRQARVLGGGLLAALAVAGPAGAALVDASEGGFRVETDPVEIVSNGGSVEGRVKWFHKDGTIQGQVLGDVTRTAGADTNCVFPVARWFYADGTENQDVAGYSVSASGDRERACNDGVAERQYDLHSIPGKDVLKVKVFLRHAPDTTSGGVTIQQQSEIVGDAPQSLGTVDQLDLDPRHLDVGGRRIFRNDDSLWKLSPSVTTAGQFDVRSRVQGELAFKDTVPGTSVTLKTRWTYADGTTRDASPVTVRRGEDPRTVLKLSPRTDALTAELSLVDDRGEELESKVMRLGDTL